MERVERRLPAILAAAGEDMAKQQIKNISRPVRVYRVTMDRGASIGMQTAPLLLPDKPSVAALPFTNMSGDLDQEVFRGRGNGAGAITTSQCRVSLPSALSSNDNSFRISAIRLLNSAALNGFRSTGISDMPLLRSASAYPVMSKVLRPG